MYGVGCRVRDEVWVVSRDGMDQVRSLFVMVDLRWIGSGELKRLLLRRLWQQKTLHKCSNRSNSREYAWRKMVL